MTTAWWVNNLRELVTMRERPFGLSIGVKASYLVLQQLDLGLTVLAISLGLNEMNPWMRNLLSSPLQLVTIKLLIPMLIAWLVPYKFLIPACILLLAVVGWNIHQLAVAIW
jgi:hypothetical protein